MRGRKNEEYPLDKSLKKFYTVLLFPYLMEKYKMA